MCLRLKEQEALAYLKDKGFKTSHAEYYRLKREVEHNTQERLNLIASQEFLAQHIQRLDTLKTIESELFVNYHNETNPTKKSNILMQIAEIQQYLSSYYDSTRYVMEQSTKLQDKKKNKQIVNNN